MIAFIALFAKCEERPPIVLLPGLYGSSLTATYAEGFAQHWYCLKKMDQEMFWVNYKYVVPPIYNCLFEMLRGYYDEETKKVTSPPGLTVGVPDFGGEEGIAYADSKGIFGKHFFESFQPMLEYLKNKGYTMKKDLWGAPYDWRLAMAGLEEPFFPQLKELIETAYEKGGRRKVCVLGYSCGGFVIQRFFGSYVNQEWKEKYIRRAIFLAPAFAGSPMTVDVAWNRYFPILPFLTSDIITQTAETVPCVHSLFPNHIVFGSTPIVKRPDGTEVTAKEIPDFLIEQGKFSSENNIKLMRENTKLSKEKPLAPGVDLMMLYNSKVDTQMTFDFKEGYDKKPEVIYTGGDGTVPAIGPNWACENWKDKDHALECVDVANPDKEFDHAGMSTNSYTHDIIYEYFTKPMDNGVRRVTLHLEKKEGLFVQASKPEVEILFSPNGEK